MEPEAFDVVGTEDLARKRREIRDSNDIGQAAENQAHPQPSASDQQRALPGSASS